jgi:16S rRNA (uracil1498-N3)-methyltransferase
VDVLPPPKLPLTLVVGLPRPKAARRLLVDATAAGVERIVLLGTWRVPKSYWQSPLLRPEAIEEHVVRGLALSGDCVPPRVETHRAFKPFAQDVLPVLARESIALVATPQATDDCARAALGAVVLCIGPERGFTGYEIDLLKAAGCGCVSLGQRTLRVHAAVHVAIGKLF